MPSTIKVRINGAHNLPINRTLSGDPFLDASVSVSLGGHAGLISHDKDLVNIIKRFETKVVRHTLNPVWNEEFRFDISDDTLLQDEPMIFKVWARDSSANKGDDKDRPSIGLVYVDLNPLLMRTANESYKHDNATKGGGGGGTTTTSSCFSSSRRSEQAAAETHSCLSGLSSRRHSTDTTAASQTRSRGNSPRRRHSQTATRATLLSVLVA